MTGSEIVWTDDFLIGIEELDYEHKSLVEHINRLHSELVKHADTEMIKGIMADIHVRMASHFALEEHYMLENEYPHYIEHKGEHNKLLDRLTGQMVGYESNPETVDIQAVEDNLKLWIVEHISKSDVKMSIMVREKIAAN